MDDFGVKYVGKEHANHLIKFFKENYDITEEWEGKHYLGPTFDWNHNTHNVHLSMPNYIPDKGGSKVVLSSIPMAITRARLHLFCGHMNGG